MKRKSIFSVFALAALLTTVFAFTSNAHSEKVVTLGFCEPINESLYPGYGNCVAGGDECTIGAEPLGTIPFTEIEYNCTY